MIVVHETTSVCKTIKPVICPKCGRGRICDIPASSQAQKSRRGKPPPNWDKIVIKCPKCGAYVTFTIE